jgi:hypothetical protein
MKDREDQQEDRMGGGLFAPDTLLPSQYFDRVRRGGEYDGERRLMVAVLEDAVDVYRKQVGATDHRRRQMFTDAEAWIEDSDRTWIFSFENICDVLGIDSGYLRNGLRAYKKQAGGDRGQVVQLRPEAVTPDAVRNANAS